MADAPIDAAVMARAARFDPQFRVPARPRTRRGIVVRVDGERLVVDGTPTRHTLRGRSATRLVPALLKHCDGRNDHADLARIAGVREDAVFGALSLLWTTGLIEDEPPAGVDVAGVPDHLADWLSRIGDATEANPAWEHAAARLAAARVVVRGDTPLAAALTGALAPTLPVHADDPTLVVLTTTGAALGGADRSLVDECWAAGTPLLRVDFDGEHVEIGPYADPAIGPCLDCLIASNPAATGRPDDTDRPEAPGRPAATDRPDVIVGADPAAEDACLLAAGLAASDIVSLISRAARVGLPTRWRRVHLARLAQAQRTGAGRPGCPACGVGPFATAPPKPPLAARYEAAVALPPREYADVKAHQMHYRPANVALQRGHKTWPVAPRADLPVPDVACLSGTPAPATATVTLDHLATLLMVTAGWQRETPDRVWRWSATGGNIGSVVAHLLVRDIAGLDPGVYGYIPSIHRLARLRDGGPPDCPDSCGGPACLLLTADLARVASKYSAFALRVVLLDAGCASTALLDTADWLGLAPRVGTDLGDRVMSDALGTDIDAEPVTGLIHLFPGSVSGAEATA